MSDPLSRDRDGADPATPTNAEHRRHADHKGGPLSRMMSAGILALVIIVLLLLVWIF